MPAGLAAVVGELDGRRGPGGCVPDEALGRQVAQHLEEPVALAAIAGQITAGQVTAGQVRLR
jgi:hypothetical protein